MTEVTLTICETIVLRIVISLLSFWSAVKIAIEFYSKFVYTVSTEGADKYAKY